MVNDATRESASQFSLRSLFFATGAAAIVLLIAAPFFRLLSGEQWWSLTKTAGAAAIGTAVWVIVASWLRHRAATRGGTPLLRITQVQRPSLRWLFLILIVYFSLLIIGICILAAWLPVRPDDWMMRYVNPFVFGAFVSQQLTFYSADTKMTMCERGVISGLF